MLVFGSHIVPSFGKKALEEWAIPFVTQLCFVNHGFILSLENVALPVFLLKDLFVSLLLLFESIFDPSLFRPFLTISVTLGIIEAFIIWRIILTFLGLASQILILVFLEIF